MNDNDAMAVPHPSEFIQEEIDARGWSMERLANEMGMESCARNKLILDMYFVVGPTHTSCRLGENTASKLAKAFGVSKEFFLNLEKAWLANKAA